ncbi:PREDICTED: centrosomal protein of 85 kDa-like [Priapulus caudatus]|uniref:Centrosomal protein of 85 kDa-like n=1 Tax=Priapulus caudatus TaxID=37621 RepID=A0ABM1F1Z9_PRICU|nr:PREDICTED: centrosomal protein of 85 kDa-like [Priapulus caudatus]
MGAAAEETARVRSECERMRKESVRLGDRLAEMERYLIMLPTEKEHRATTRKLRTLVEERDIERRHLEAARGELATAARRETDKDDAMARLREELGERDGQIAALRARIERAAEEEAVNREGTPETLAEMRKRIGMLSGELAKYRKVFAVKHSKDTRQLEQHQRTIHELRERQQQEDSALVGTRAELNAREADLRQLRGSKREVNKRTAFNDRPIGRW